MINNIFYVEDGSVDIDELKNLLDEDSHMIDYYKKYKERLEELTLEVDRLNYRLGE